MYQLSLESKATVLRAFVEGCSIRSIERMTGHHRDTIMRLVVDAGAKANQTMATLIKDVPLKSIQIDELWTFVQKKDKCINSQEDCENIGTQFIFVAIDSDTKLVPCFKVGKRNLVTASVLMWLLRDRVKGRPQITTDSMASYPEAVDKAFGDNVDYAQLIKVYHTNGNPRQEGYSPVDFVKTKYNVVWGNPQRRISTSYIERLNFTLRMSSRRLTRLTNAFSKKMDNLKASLGFYFAYYNFARIHGSLRIGASEKPALLHGIGLMVLMGMI